VAEYSNARLYINVCIRRRDSTQQSSPYELKQLTDFKRIRSNEFVYFPYSFGDRNEIVLKVDVTFKSSTKLVLEDVTGAVVRGNADEAAEQHMLRFETQSVVGTGILSRLYREYRGIQYAKGKVGWMSEFDWFIADVDDYLLGNPFCNFSSS
jgi:hypothetical protein